MNHEKSHFSLYCHLIDLLNKRGVFVIKRMNIIALFVTVSLVAVIVVGGASMIITPPVNAQENSTSSQSQNATTTTMTNATGAAEEKTYILVFGQRTVGNIDNSTKIVPSIVGDNSAKIQEEFLEEISLAPSQQLEEQINTIVNDAINGSSCDGASLTTQEGENVSVDCISSGNTIIWYIHPNQ
jgi:hypothetical protein